MRVCSIDVGIKNLAYCVVESCAPGQIEIRAWRLLGFAGKTMADTVHGLHALLVQHAADFEGCRDVLIERQAGLNKRMVCLCHSIQMFFLCRGRAVVLCDPRKKLSAFLPRAEGRKTYSETKALAIHHAKKTLEAAGQTVWLDFLGSNRKQDDLADSLCQAVSWMQSRPRGVTL